RFVSRCCRGDRRALRSFPTRRSSDLQVGGGGGGGGAINGVGGGSGLAGGGGTGFHGGIAHLTFTISGTGRTGDGTYGLPGGNGQDRKSTRLNSLHSQISYAVFCLKKK